MLVTLLVHLYILSFDDIDLIFYDLFCVRVGVPSPLDCCSVDEREFSMAVSCFTVSAYWSLSKPLGSKTFSITTVTNGNINRAIRISLVVVCTMVALICMD